MGVPNTVQVTSRKYNRDYFSVNQQWKLPIIHFYLVSKLTGTDIITFYECEECGHHNGSSFDARVCREVPPEIIEEMQLHVALNH